MGDHTKGLPRRKLRIHFCTVLHRHGRGGMKGTSYVLASRRLLMVLRSEKLSEWDHIAERGC